MTHLSDEAVEWLARHGSRPDRQPAALQLGWIQHVDACAECRERIKNEKANNTMIEQVKLNYITRELDRLEEFKKCGN